MTCRRKTSRTNGSWVLPIHRPTVTASKRTTESSGTPELSKRSTCCEVRRHYLEQLSWFRSWGWVHQLQHEFIVLATILPAKIQIFEVNWYTFSNWESPGQDISQKKTLICKSVVCVQWRWSAIVRRQHVGNAEGLRKYLTVPDQTCYDEIELGTASRWRSRVKWCT